LVWRENEGIHEARYTFVILRDPFLRLVSCFLDKMVDLDNPAWLYHRLLNYKRPPHELTFRQFVRNLKPHIRADEHWRPQIDFLVYKNYDDIFCLEHFEQAVLVLREKINLEIHDARDLTRHGTDRYSLIDSDNCFADMSAFDLLSMKRSGKVPRLANFYDDELASGGCKRTVSRGYQIL
jgi:hypothetical protein